MYETRLRRVLEYMREEGLEQIVVSATASVYYLTGIWVEPMERMLALYIRSDGACTLYANELFGLTEGAGLPLRLHRDSDVPTAELAAALRPGRLGVDKAWPSKFLIGVLEARRDIVPVLGSGPVDRARMYKDGEEIAAMRSASAVNDQVMELALSAVREGAREDELDGIAALPRRIAGVQVGVTLREQPDGSYKVSLRTNEGVDASQVCSQLGGGGHARAAGCNLKMEQDAAVQAILQTLRPYLEQIPDNKE